MRRLACLMVWALLVAAARGAVDAPAMLAAWNGLSSVTPRTAAGFAKADTTKIVAAARLLEQLGAEHLAQAERAVDAFLDAPPPEPEPAPRFGTRRGVGQPVAPRFGRARRGEPPAEAPVPVPAPTVPGISLESALEPLFLAKQRVDSLFDELLKQRGEFAAIGSAEDRHTALRNYLRTLSALVDLTGRLRYLHSDATSAALDLVEGSPADQERLIGLLSRYRSTIGAWVLAGWLFDQPPLEPGEPVLREPDSIKSKVLTLLLESRQSDLLPELGRFVMLASTSPALVLQGAEAIRSLGLPQEPRPGQDPTLPPVAIAPAKLRERLVTLAGKLDSRLEARRQQLLVWLDERIARGVTDQRYELGHGEFAPGDWLLMRNPSPYNLFTDLSPGLFTHVGVVAEEQGTDGRTRIVLVDLPERGTTMPATTVDTFVKRTRHYLVLRHADPEVARAMGAAATDMIGNPTQFDLNFRTSRVNELLSKPLKGEKIHTYCAGLLLLTALSSGREREEFFPIVENAANAQTAENLKTFGMSIGDDFVSPTGALFSAKFRIVARREPMYDPRREVEEAIYDHFAESLAESKIVPPADLFQTLRLKMAEAAKSNPLLAEALAKAAGVSSETDLVAAAKAAAVVETLDEVAKGQADEFLAAAQAIKAGSAAEMRAAGLKTEQILRSSKLQERHADLFARWLNESISPRAMRLELVQYYVAAGKQKIDERFFGGSSKAPPRR